MSWELKSAVKELSNQEIFLDNFSYHKRHRVAFLYPNTYNVGMSNLGMHIIYNIVNSMDDVCCERFFLPDGKALDKYIKTNSSLYSIETQRKMLDFDIIAVGLSFEGDYFNLLQMLELGRVQLEAAKRKDMEPFVIVGGPCATFNPMPLSLVADAFIIGEGEQSFAKLVEVLTTTKNLGRAERLEQIAAIDGVYVPTLHNPVRRQFVSNLQDFPNHSVIITPQTEFGRMLIVELSRGCGRGCRFCMAGYAFRYPRHRALADIQHSIDKYSGSADKIGLMGPAVSDYPEILELSEYILEKNLDFSVASLRADTLTPKLVDHLAQSGQRTLTIAPEAGSQRLRDIINKGISEENIYASVELLAKTKIPNLKLYIMLGLPFEEDADIEQLIEMVQRIRSKMNEVKASGKLILSINTFVPKPFTPFQWLPMADKKTIEARLKMLRQAFKSVRGVEINAESYKESVIQALLAKGDRRIAECLLIAHERGGVKQLLNVLKEQELNIDDYIYTTADANTVLPWECIEMGFSKEYLWQEYLRAKDGKRSPNCMQKCRRCGVCKDGNEL